MYIIHSIQAIIENIRQEIIKIEYLDQIYKQIYIITFQSLQNIESFLKK